MFDLVENPEDRFSGAAAQLLSIASFLFYHGVAIDRGSRLCDSFCNSCVIAVF